MKNLIFFLLGMLIGMNGYCAVPDSTLYTSDFEKDVFTRLTALSAVNSIDLFIALGYKPANADISKRVETYANDLKNKVSQLSLTKKIKTVYKNVHSSFLTKYSEDVYFNDIFSSGEYNCVTASALYAVILTKLGIPYIIKETPTHVYLIADQGNMDFYIETTLPKEKILQIDEKSKNDFVVYLHNNKIISNEDYQEKSTEQLFNEHYTKDKTITLKELAGTQYYNKGIFQFNKANYPASLMNFEKAEMLYPSDLIKYMKSATLGNMLDQEMQLKEFDGTILAKYINANDSNSYNLQHARNYFDAVSREMMVNHPDENKFKNFLHDFTSQLSTKDTAEYYQTFYTLMGYYCYTNNRFSDALYNLGRAYRINPDNINIRDMVTQCFAKGFLNENNYRHGVDSINLYSEKFPFLKDDKYCLTFMEYFYARNILDYFANDNPIKGNENLKKFESYLAEHHGIIINETSIEQMYSAVGSYYLSKNKLDQAEQVFLKGVRTVPGSNLLKNMLKSTIRAKGDYYEYPETMDNKNIDEDFSDFQKMNSAAVEAAKKNRATTNENIDKYLPNREWRMSKATMGGVQKEAPSEMRISFKFLSNNKVECKSDDESVTGSWQYDRENCTIDILVEGDHGHMIIEEISEFRIKSFLYGLEKDHEGFEVEFTASSKP